MNNKLKKLEVLYDQIPSIECKGLCFHTCTMVPAAKIEIKRARGRMGGKNPFNPVSMLNEMKKGNIPSCAALKDNKCSIYSSRPAICRLYGVAEGLKCNYGCESDKYLTKEEANRIIREIESL